MVFTKQRISGIYRTPRNPISRDISDTVFEVNERNVNKTDCIGLDNGISYFLRLHRRVGCVTH